MDLICYNYVNNNKLMKNGKKIRLRLFNNVKIYYGTIDYIDLKSIYITIQAWVTPKAPNDNWKKVVCTQSREIKHTIFDINNLELFNKNSIVDFDIRYSGVEVGKKSFMNLEITLLTNPNTCFKSQETKDSIRKIIKQIYHTNIRQNKYFDFFLTKKDFSI
jgi:hypothetical protein